MLRRHSSRKVQAQPEKFFFLKMPRGSGIEKQVDKIAVITESECGLSNSEEESDESYSCCSSEKGSKDGSYEGLDGEGS